jgi:hypothetical protein
MVELLLIPGNPLRLSRECSRQARKFELLSTAALSAGIIINLYLVFWILSVVIR